MPRLISLDLGSHAVKVSVYRIGGREVDLEGRYHQPVPQDGAMPDLPTQLVALATLLDDVAELKPEGGDSVVVAYPSTRASFHRVSLPFTDRAQIEGTLPFTLEEEVPFDLDDMVLGWRIAEQVDGSEIVAVMARHELLAEWLAALDEHGIDPVAVHVDADVYGPWGAITPAGDGDDPELEDPSAPLVAVVDVGHAHSTLTVVRNGVAQMCRSISTGGYAFTRAIQQALDCTWAQAEAFKHGGPDVDGFRGPADDEPTERVSTGLPPKAREALDGAMGLLLAEIRSTLIKAEDQLGSEVLEVRVTGGSSQLDGLAGRLSADLGVPVRQAVDPSGDAASGVYALSAALAWASVPGVTSAIDLRIGDLQFRGGTNLVRAALTYGVAGALFFTLAATAMFGWQYYSLSTEQAEAEQAVFDIVRKAMDGQPGVANIETLSAASALMAGATEDASQLAAVVGNGDGVPYTIDTLYQLTNAFPPHPEVKVELENLTITRETIAFDAETDNFNSSAQVELKLQSSDRFRTATKGQEQRLSNGRVRFPITITLGDADTAEEG